MSDITIYTTPTCAYCHATKEFLKAHGVEFAEKDVTEDFVAQQEMIQKSGQLGVPVTVAGDEVIVGFDQPRLHALVEKVKQ